MSSSTATARSATPSRASPQRLSMRRCRGCWRAPRRLVRTMAARLPFLEAEVTPKQLLAAIVAHHRQWFVEQARMGRGEVRREQGATWVLARDAEYHSIGFP